MAPSVRKSGSGASSGLVDGNNPSLISLEGSNFVVNGHIFLSDVPDNITLSPSPATLTEKTICDNAGSFVGFDSKESKDRHVVHIGKLKNIKFMSIFRFKVWWTTHWVGSNGGDLEHETQMVMLDKSDDSGRPYVLLLPLIEGPFRASLQPGDDDNVDVCVESGSTKVCAAGFRSVVYLHAGDDPFNLVKEAMEAVRVHLGTFKLLEEKTPPGIVDKFGWCTWDAFYLTVHPQGVWDGVKGLVDGGCPPGLVLIDDGWQSISHDEDSITEEGMNAAVGAGEQMPCRLLRFQENYKFRDYESLKSLAVDGVDNKGMGAFVKDLKEEFNTVDYVYVWHALCGYWGGLRPNVPGLPPTQVVKPKLSPGLEMTMEDLAVDKIVNNGVGLVPPEIVDQMYDGIHSHLAKVGIDGVTQIPSAITGHGNNPQFPSAIVKEEVKDDEARTTEALVLPEAKKRKHHALREPREARAVRSSKAKETSLVYKCKQIKRENPISVKKENVMDRWSVDRYNQAEKSMLEVMKAEGAVFEKPISRSALRMVARKHIGDTGLLDHLLKHIDGKVAPGGTERFCRCYNTQGKMEYWLESADLVKIKQEAGVPDPNYVPPSWLRPGSVAPLDSVSAEELTLLRKEVAKMTRDMEELVSKNQEQHQANHVGDIYKEFVEWRGKTDQRLMEISSSLGGLQGKYKEMMAWKSKIEQQLKEISNSLSSLQSSKQCNTLSPVSERWEDWLESTNLDNIQGEDFAPWLENMDLVNVGYNASLKEPYNASQLWLKPCDSPSQEPVCATELELLKEEMAKMKRDMQGVVPNRMEEDKANMTSDSSANSKTELDNLFFQEMLKDFGKWRKKMEQQMLEISNAVNTLQASK